MEFQYCNVVIGWEEGMAGLRITDVMKAADGDGLAPGHRFQHQLCQQFAFRNLAVQWCFYALNDNILQD